MNNFRKDLEEVINRHSKENGSNTPDWILGSMIVNVLKVFDGAVNERERWYGRAGGEPEQYLVEAPTSPSPGPMPI